MTQHDQTEPLAFDEKALDANNILSRKQRYRLRKEGRFPEPRKIGSRNLYIAREIREWLEDPEGWVDRDADPDPEEEPERNAGPDPEAA